MYTAQLENYVERAQNKQKKRMKDQQESQCEMKRNEIRRNNEEQKSQQTNRDL